MKANDIKLPSCARFVGGPKAGQITNTIAESWKGNGDYTRHDYVFPETMTMVSLYVCDDLTGDEREQAIERALPR